MASPSAEPHKTRPPLFSTSRKQCSMPPRASSVLLPSLPSPSPLSSLSPPSSLSSIPSLPARSLHPSLSRNAIHQTLRHSTTSTTSSSTSHTVDSARQYCRDLLSTHDVASYQLTPFMHSRARDAHLAIRAFNVDIARIDDAVSNTVVGRMRMQFWRDAVGDVFSGRAPPREPVAVLLRKVLREDEAPLGRGWFLKIIATREQYLGSAPFPTLDALEAYAEGTYSSLHYLLLEAHHRHSPALDHVASHLGKAAGIVSILRGIPYLAHSSSSTHSPSSSVVLPLDILAAYNVRQEDILRHGGSAAGLKDAVFEVATRANDHMITARKMLADAGEEGKGGWVFSVFLGAVGTRVYLERLEGGDFDPFGRGVLRLPWSLPWKLYRAWATKTF